MGARGAARLRHARHGAIKKGDAMRRQLTAVLSFAFVAASGAVLAHHGFAMFDQENPIELEGVVQEFKFTSPHSFIILAVKRQDGGTQLWSLEGAAPSALARDGWSSKTLKPGDELIHDRAVAQRCTGRLLVREQDQAEGRTTDLCLAVDLSSGRLEK